MSILKRILQRGRAFQLPNENQFATVKRYKAVPLVTAQWNGCFWQRVKL